MRIVQLTAENVKKLRAVEITPTGELVEITGKNGAGKTSVLDSIMFALAGAKHIQAMPIRKGEKTARIRLNLGELVVARTFTEKGSTLTVESADGARFGSPQAILDALLGELTFDPLAFATEEAREQFETLRAIVPLEVDVDKLDGLNASDFAKRTELNRDAKAKRAQADGTAVPDGLPRARLDTGAIKDLMAEAADSNASRERLVADRDRVGQEALELQRRAAADRERAKQLRAEAARLEDGAEHLDRRAGALQAQVVATTIPAPVDVVALRQQLDQAEALNRGIDARERKAALLTDATALEKAAEELTATMEARTKAKTEAIAKAPMPVEGLGFGAGVVTFQGVPFEQASDAERLRVSVAIAMAANPKLRVLRIREGSLLDADNLALLGQMARERDYQIWIERVDTSGKVGIVIEDGAVVAVNTEPTQS